MVANIRMANGNFEAALPNSQPVLTYNPGMLPQPTTLATGNTCYPGETTGYDAGPTFDLLGLDTADSFPPAAGIDEFVDHEGSQCSTAASIDQVFRNAHGKILQKWCDPNSGRNWLCEDGEDPDFYCWESEHPAYVAPAIGVTQADADLHAATENANRAAHEASVARAKAHSAEMRPTAFSETAAEEADRALEERRLPWPTPPTRPRRRKKRMKKRRR